MFRSDYSEERLAVTVKSLNILKELRLIQKIEAIKLFRTLTGAGLKDAKARVEAIDRTIGLG
jgi:ribosomal protein L7/L12